MQPAVYILSNPSRTVLYVGVTNDLERRMQEHKLGTGSTFASRYNCVDLLYYDTASDMENAIAEEKRIKAGSRKKKLELIESINPDWIDLSAGWNI